jgi:hypothetical protein
MAIMINQSFYFFFHSRGGKEKGDNRFGVNRAGGGINFLNNSTFVSINNYNSIAGLASFQFDRLQLCIRFVSAAIERVI